MPRLSLDDLFRITVPSDPQLRPDGGAVAYTLTGSRKDPDENRTEIWLAAPGAEPRRLAEGSCPRWSPDGRALAYLRPVDGVPQNPARKRAWRVREGRARFRGRRSLRKRGQVSRRGRG